MHDQILLTDFNQAKHLQQIALIRSANVQYDAVRDPQGHIQHQLVNLRLLSDRMNPDSHLFAKLLLYDCPKSFDGIELATVGWEITYCEVITKKVIDYLTVMSAVIVYHEMRTICCVAEACYYLSQELLEVHSVG